MRISCIIWIRPIRAFCCRSLISSPRLMVFCMVVYSRYTPALTKAKIRAPMRVSTIVIPQHPGCDARSLGPGNIRDQLHEARSLGTPGDRDADFSDILGAPRIVHLIKGGRGEAYASHGNGPAPPREALPRIPRSACCHVA